MEKTKKVTDVGRKTMLFNSYVFVLAFLPLAWSIYFLLNRFRLYKWAHASLIVASFVFYGWQDWRLCILLLATIVVNYAFHLILIRLPAGVWKKLVLVSGIFVNLSLLFYFKYWNFAFETLYTLLGRGYVLKNIVLPLGISFYTFQQISMLVDSSKPDMKRYDFLDYALFVSFFPQLIAGPIVLHQEMIPQFHDLEKKKINYGNITAGIEYFILGFAKKVLVADYFARICDAGYEHLEQLNVYSAVLTILAFTLQIYFDFSGYCDMAKGLGKLFNIDITINFNSPYKALTITEFWKRWHMTLTRFLTQYLYVPLGGNRKGKWRTYANIMIVFSISGLWHGADWSFIIWGVMHGVMQVLCRMGKDTIAKIPKWIQWSLTFILINIAWVFFRADYTRQPILLFSRLFTGGGGWCQDALLTEACDTTMAVVLLEKIFVSGAAVIRQLWVAAVFVFWTWVCAKMPSTHEIVERKNRSSRYFVALGIIFVWAFLCLSQVSKFIYFNF